LRITNNVKGEGSMKVAKCENGAIAISVTKGAGHRTPVPTEAPKMLCFTLGEAKVKGKFALQVTGNSQRLLNKDNYVMYVRQFGEIAKRQLRVEARCGNGIDSTISAVLHVPSEIDMEDLCHKVTKKVSELNDTKWSSYLKGVVPQKEVPQTTTHTQEECEPESVSLEKELNPGVLVREAFGLIGVEGDEFEKIIDLLAVVIADGIAEGSVPDDCFTVSVVKLNRAVLRHLQLSGSVAENKKALIEYVTKKLRPVVHKQHESDRSWFVNAVQVLEYVGGQEALQIRAEQVRSRQAEVKSPVFSPLVLTEVMNSGDVDRVHELVSRRESTRETLEKVSRRHGEAVLNLETLNDRLDELQSELLMLSDIISKAEHEEKHLAEEKAFLQSELDKLSLSQEDIQKLRDAYQKMSEIAEALGIVRSE